MKSNNTQKGDCEASHFDGKGVDVDLRLVHGDMWLCADCILAEQRAEERSRAAALTVVQSRKTDTLIELKQDIFIAGTVPFVELQAAIFNDDAIPADKKWSALVAEADARYKVLSDAIFAEEAILIAKKNARQALHVNIQEATARLQKAEREKYKQYDVNYKPVKPTKAEKTTKPVTSSKTKYDKKLLHEIATKYNLPSQQILANSVARNISYEMAAQRIIRIMNGEE